MAVAPSGTVEEMPDGRRRQRQYHDFFNYAGLHRGVWLYSTPPSHIADATVTTDLEGGTGIVRCRTAVVADCGVAVRVELRDAEGRIVARGTGEEAELRVSDAALWRPGHGYL